jgi:rare lipoprotein A
MKSHRSASRRTATPLRHLLRATPLWILGGLVHITVGCAAQSAAAQSTSAANAGPAPRATVEKSERVPRGTQTGRASFIADSLDGRKTASGEAYDKNSLVAAHPSYPLGTMVRVTNQENGRAVEVKIVDRPAPPAARRNHIIDLSRAAAERLDFVQRGTAKVTTEVLQWGEGHPGH